VAAWLLDTALFVILQVVAEAVAIVGGHDVRAALGGSECKRRGRRVSWGAVVRAGSEHHHL